MQLWKVALLCCEPALGVDAAQILTTSQFTVGDNTLQAQWVRAVAQDTFFCLESLTQIVRK